MKLELSGIPTAAEPPEMIGGQPRDLVSVGRVLAGRYEICSRLGAGGMGAVYRAYDRELREDIALKVILTAHIEDESAIERLRREVKLARQITHPNVCRVFDLGESDGLYFLTMELVEGRTLRQWLAAGPLQPDRALHFLEQIAEGLSAAHAQGIVHGDLKPENVLVRDDGRAVVADFGISRKAHLDDTAAPRREGTPAYMSPEQLRGEWVDVRSDVFTLGVVGFELLTGQRPFDAGTPGTSSLPILTEPPRPLEVPGLGEPVLCALRELFARALATQPDQRFQSAAEFSKALSDARRATPAHSTFEGVSEPEAILPRAPAGQARREAKHWLPRVLMAVLALVAIGFGGWKGWRARGSVGTAGAPPVSAGVGLADVPVAMAVRSFENPAHDAQWDALARSAAESIASGLRTIPHVRLSDGAPADRTQARAQGIVYVVRGSVQRIGADLRLLAEIEPVEETDRVPMVEPVEIAVDSVHLADALDALRSRVLDEARIAVRYHEKRRRAIRGTTSDGARAKLLTYYGMVGLWPRPDQYEIGLSLLNEALAADSRYVPALVEHAYLRIIGAGGGTSAQQLADALADVEAARSIQLSDGDVAVAFCQLRQQTVEASPRPTDALIEQAMAACRNALAAAPGSAHVHIALARLNDRLCMDEDAMRALESAADLDRSLSGRALTHLVGLAVISNRMLVAERMSERLVAFGEEERRLGPRALSRRAGAPEARGVYLYRGVVLLRLGRFNEAQYAFQQELGELAVRKRGAWAEATAIRGLQLATTAQKGSMAPVLAHRLTEIEAETRARIKIDPDAAKTLAQAYRLVDPAAAIQWIEPQAAPRTCEEALQRARIYHSAGNEGVARALLGTCSPVEQWEKNCVDQLAARLAR